MKRKIKTTATRQEVEKLVRDLPGILSGRLNSRYGLHRIYWGAIANSMFTSIYEAFITKSRGQTDDLGITWPDITQHTKAYKRDVKQGGTKQSVIRRRKYNVENETGRGLLSPQENKAWKRIFGRIYYRYKNKLGEEAAKVKAGQYAWTALKNMNAPTMWEVLGNRDLMILRRTDRLSESLAPGEFNVNSGYRKNNRDQVFILHRGKITVGSNVPYALFVERGRFRRVIWPQDLSIWLDRANEAGRDAVFERLQNILK